MAAGVQTDVDVVRNGGLEGSAHARSGGLDVTERSWSLF